MARIILRNFTIKPVKLNKAKVDKTYKRISRKCLAKVILNDNNEYCACIKVPNTDSEFLIFPFTENSLDLKDKTYVFSKYLDERGRRICIIREPHEARYKPGNKEHLEVLHDGIVVAGYIVTKNNVKYFDYLQLVSFSTRLNAINPIEIDEESPIYKL